jgi:hypothetical protein
MGDPARFLKLPLVAGWCIFNMIFNLPRAFIARRRYLYEASSLCVIPHLPPDVTALEQKLPVRWGHYQIFISTTGSRTHGITAVALNGKPLPLSHAGSGGSSFNRTVVVLEYDALPAPSAAAVSAMGSTELAIFDALTLNITFGAPATSENLLVRPAAAPPPPPPLHRSRLQRSQVNGPLMAGLVVWLDAASIPSATPTGTALSHWPNHVAGGVTNLTQPDATKRPTFHGSGLGPGLASVHFDGGHETGQELTGSLWLSTNRTILWVLKDEGSPTTIASGVVYTWPAAAGSSGSTALGGLSTARDSDGTMKVAVDGDGWNMLGFVAPSKLKMCHAIPSAFLGRLFTCIDWPDRYSDITNKTTIGAAAFGLQNASGLDSTAQVSLNVNSCANGYRKAGLTGANGSLHKISVPV